MNKPPIITETFAFIGVMFIIYQVLPVVMVAVYYLLLLLTT